jgi:hypothetical protein
MFLRYTDRVKGKRASTKPQGRRIDLSQGQGGKCSRTGNLQVTYRKKHLGKGRHVRKGMVRVLGAAEWMTTWACDRLD